MDAFLCEYKKETNHVEKQVRLLREEVAKLRNSIQERVINDLALEKNTKLEKLITLNIKLKHRLSILNKAISSFCTKDMSSFDNDKTRLYSILNVLNDAFFQVMVNVFPDITDPPVVVTCSNVEFADYQCNSAMQLSKIYKLLGKKINPRDIAIQIVNNFQTHKLIDKLEVAGPGFINIYLNKHVASQCLKRIFEYGIKPPVLEKKFRVLVDFSSPNIAKEMHVGHLRSTIIGDSISRWLEFLGHDVIRINHIGDWGTQFGMLIAHLQDKFPDYLQQSPPIKDLQSFYKESKKRFDDDKEFKKRAYSSVVKLQAHDPDYKKAWELICQVSRQEFQKIYNRLDIKLIERGESFYHSKMKAIVNELEHGGYLEQDEGRLVMWGDQGEGNIPLTVVKSDGGYTYDTSDLAAIKYRIVEEKVDWIIYVTDAGQAMHFHTLFKCAKRAKILPETVRVDHVSFGVVLGEDKKKFKTRSGDTVRLLDLLDQGLERALNKLMEKNRHQELNVEELKAAQESVAYGCIKYADLSHNRNHEYVFSFDKMLEDKGNTAIYLLYAFTRIKSIARTVELNNEDKIKDLAKKYDISIDHEKEWKLITILLRFPDVLLDVKRDLCLHRLCEYVYNIATNFTEFYDSCYCIEKDSSGDIVKVNYGRILLVEAVALIMEKCFQILGLKPVTKM